LPLSGFSAFLVVRSAMHEQDALAMMARNRTQIAAAAIEDELGSLRARLFLLAGGLSLQTSDLNEFHGRAKELFGGMSVMLTNAAGQEIVNTAVPYGEPLPDNPDWESIRRVAENSQPWIGDLCRDSGTGRPMVMVSVPVTRDSRLAYVLSLDISSTLPRIMRELKLPEGWVSAIFDRQGYMIVRSFDQERFVGTLARPRFLKNIQSANEGWVPGLSLDGVPLFNAFAHAWPSGWTVNVGIPRDILLAPVQQTTWTLIWLGGATLALALVLAVLIGERIAGPIIGLVPIAEAVGRGEPAELRLGGLTEANVVARSLFDASERLRGAAAEREAATVALTESERMYRALAEDLARIDAERTGLLNRVVVAQENERRRIARELHDSLAQYLTALRLKFDALAQSGAPTPGALGELRSLIDELDGAVNRMAWELRPVALEELGLHSAVDHYLEEWSELARLPVDARIDLGGRVLPPAIEATLFRVLQEATTNVLRHAGASQLGVILEAGEDRVRLIVEDDGKGISTDDGKPPFAATRRFGLLGMRERLALVDGELDVESTPGSGTTLFVSIPLGGSSPGHGGTYRDRKDLADSDGGRPSDRAGGSEGTG
jgi:signal transduction histidine kinase